MANKETGSNNKKPDYGVYVAKAMPNATGFNFMPFTARDLTRIGDSSYTTCSTHVHLRQEYLLSLDFSREAYLQLLSILPAGLAEFVKKAFDKPFEGRPTMVDFSAPILLNVKAKPGKKTTYGDEEFISFEVTEVSFAGAPATAAPAATSENINKTMITELSKALYKVGKTGGFISPKGKRNPEAIEIGEALNKLGGITAMMSAARPVIALLREAHDLDLAGELNHCWNGIGEWMA